MPLYVYKCPRCGTVAEVQRKIVDMDAPLACYPCAFGAARDFSPSVEPPQMQRQPTAPSGVFPGAASWRSR